MTKGVAHIDFWWETFELKVKGDGVTISGSDVLQMNKVNEEFESLTKAVEWLVRRWEPKWSLYSKDYFEGGKDSFPKEPTDFVAYMIGRGTLSALEGLPIIDLLRSEKKHVS